jgi:RNA polymerase sigma factor (sigma-70 family)
MKTDVVINSGLGHSSSIFDEDYLARLRSGDEETAKHFNTYFRRLLGIKVWAKFGRADQEEMIDEVMAAAIEKILLGQPRDPANLAAYVRAIGANLAGKPRLVNCGIDFNFERISDPSLTAEERILNEERAKTVRTVLQTLKPRDRHILVDLFYNELEREEVCRKYAVTREQLRLVLFRARGRFQEKWEKKAN